MGIAKLDEKITHHVRDMLRAIKDPGERDQRIGAINAYLTSDDRPAIIAGAMRSLIVYQNGGIGTTDTDRIFHIVNADLAEFDMQVPLKDNEKLNLRNFYLRFTEIPKKGRLFIYVSIIIEVLRSKFAKMVTDQLAFKEAIAQENVFNFVDNWLSTGSPSDKMRRRAATTMDVYDNMRSLLRIGAPFPRDLERMFKGSESEAHFVGYRCGSTPGELVKTFIVCHRPPLVLMKSPYFTVFHPFPGPGKERRVRKSVGAIMIYENLIYMVGVSAEVEPTDDKIDIDSSAEFLGFKILVLNESDFRLHTDVISGLALSHDRVSSAISSRIILFRAAKAHHSELKLGVVKADDFFKEVTEDGLDISEATAKKTLDYLQNKLSGESGFDQALTMQPLRL